jgi:DNA-binding MarR family transcriptional regulator
MPDFLEKTPYLFHAIDTLYMRLDEAFMPGLEAAGISRQLWVLFRQIERSPGLTQTDLATLLSRDKVRLGRELDELEDRNLIQRVQSENDRRAKRIFPVFGKRIMGLMRKVDREAFDAAFRHVPPKDMETFYAVMLSAIEALENVGVGRQRRRAKLRVASGG